MNELITLFSDMGLISAVCLAVGLVLCTIEIFVPGFGIFGITGTILLVFSLVFRIIIGGSLLQFIYMLLIIISVLAIIILISLRSARFGLLSRSPIIQSGTALPKDFSDDKKNYAYLLGKGGVTKTICKPIGKIEIDSVEYQAITNGDYLERGTDVKVVEVDGSTIVIRKA